MQAGTKKTKTSGVAVRSCVGTKWLSLRWNGHKPVSVWRLFESLAEVTK
jgi:hypothetical protein